MNENELCKRIRLFGVRYSSRLPYRWENSKLNIFRHVINAKRETILHSWMYCPLRLLARSHVI